MTPRQSLSRLKNRLLARVFTAVPGLAARWGQAMAATGGEIPWAEPRKPLGDAVLAVITTGGVHRTDQPPFDMADPDGDPTFREIPVDTPGDALTITHDYYDHRDAEADPNLVLPVERVREMTAHGVVAGLHPRAYSFMGHIDGRHVETLKRKTAPEVAERLAAGGVDYALLVPA